MSDIEGLVSQSRFPPQRIQDTVEPKPKTGVHNKANNHHLDQLSCFLYPLSYPQHTINHTISNLTPKPVIPIVTHPPI